MFGIKLKIWAASRSCLQKTPSRNKCFIQNVVPDSDLVMKFPLLIDNLSVSGVLFLENSWPGAPGAVLVWFLAQQLSVRLCNQCCVRYWCDIYVPLDILVTGCAVYQENGSKINKMTPLLATNLSWHWVHYFIFLRLYHTIQRDLAKNSLISFFFPSDSFLKLY